MGINFLTWDEVPYGEVQVVSPLIRRVTANNPGPYTYTGTGTYIVGHGEVAIIDPGPDDKDHVAALLRAVAGERVAHILVTHTHTDHSPATAALATATGATVYAYGPHPEEPDDAVPMEPNQRNPAISPSYPTSNYVTATSSKGRTGPSTSFSPRGILPTIYVSRCEKSKRCLAATM